jgi:hypothetical protein
MIGSLRKLKWLFPVLILCTLLLGTISFHQYYVLHDIPPNWFSAFYASLQLFVLESGGVDGPIPLALEIARFLAPALTAGGIFLALWEPFNQSFLLFKIRFWKNHIIVCGLSKKAELLIMNFLSDEKEKFDIVLIELNPDHSSISHLRKKGVIVLDGDATDEEILLRANVLNAKYLLALTEDEKTNIHIAQKTSSVYNQFPEKIPEENILQVNIHIDDFYTMNIFKEFHEKATPDMEEYRKGGSKIDYHAFSIYQLAAMSMVDNFSPDKYVSLSNDDDPPAHLLILGDNVAVQYLILEAAQMYHFANLHKTRITVVADDVQSILQKIRTHYPFLDQTVDIEYVSTDDFFRFPCPIPCDELSVCFVALDDDGKSVYYSRKLRQHLFAVSSRTKDYSLRSFKRYNNFRQATPPIKVLLPRNTALVNIFDDVAIEMRALNIELLHMDDEVCNKKTIVDNRKEEDFIAKHIHYEWAKNQAFKTNVPVGTMQQEWDKLRDAQKDANRLPARHLQIKLRYVKADLSDQEAGEELDFETLEEQIWDKIARMEHNRWVAEKSIGGFVLAEKPSERSLAVFLKENLKSHWDLVPFDQLDKETQEYDKFTFKMAPVIAHLNHKRIIKRQNQE